MSVVTLVVVQAIALVLLGCAASGPVLIRGELASREHIALTADSVAIVELTRAEDGRVIAEQRLPLADRQVPMPFELQAQRTAFEGGKTYLLRGAIALKGRTRWLSDPVEVRAHPGPISVGTLILRPYEPVAFSSPLVCGDRRASVGIGRSGQREFLQLTVEGERFALYETITASGSRYDAVDDVRTYIRFKGQRATLTVRGMTYPECTGGN
ncbi:MAG: YbaY family lipoprotein [Betaproteobacteria bacterium]